MRWSALPILLLALAVFEPAQATDFTIYNRSDNPIYVWFKLGWQRNWPDAISLQPNHHITIPLSGRGTIDVWTRYYTNETKTAMVDRAALGVNIEDLAAKSLTDKRTWSKSATAGEKRTWRQLDSGRWVAQSSVAGYACQWTFYGRDGNVSLALPQDLQQTSVHMNPDDIFFPGQNNPPPPPPNGPRR